MDGFVSESWGGRGWKFERVATSSVREVLSVAYAQLIAHRMYRGGESDLGRCAAVGMAQRRRVLSSRATPRPMGVRDERVKLAGACVYCTALATSLDHLVPRFADGPDSVDNLVPACRYCNSSKGSTDVFVWAAAKGFFPLGVVRRYLVLAWRWCGRAGLLERPKRALGDASVPFRLDTINWSRSLPLLRG